MYGDAGNDGGYHSYAYTVADIPTLTANMDSAAEDMLSPDNGAADVEVALRAFEGYLAELRRLTGRRVGAVAFLQSAARRLALHPHPHRRDHADVGVRVMLLARLLQ